MSPERFGRSCRDRARRLERDAGVERNRRQRKQTFVSRKHNPATGMIEGRFAFHPELAERVFGPRRPRSRRHHHHHVLHELAWHVDLAPDRVLTIIDRDGHTLFVTEPDVPPQRHRHHRTKRRTAA